MNSLASLPGLLPAGSDLEIEQVAITPEAATLTVRTAGATANCPRCGHSSQRVHSRYRRKLADLPWQGRVVMVRLISRRFFCTAATCEQKVFVERLPEVAKVYARTTLRLHRAHGKIGLALGGEAGSRLAKQLAMPTSPDTLLRRVKQYPSETVPNPRIIGIDDWAWRKGQRYGTILIDLERGSVLDLLPDRKGQTLQAWLRGHPQIELISRDRSGIYAQAASAAAPQAKQVADRWHLMKNLREAIERIFDRCYSSIRSSLTPGNSSAKQCSDNTEAEVDATLELEPPPVSQHRQAQKVKRARRAERFEQVRQLYHEGRSISRIAKTLGIGRETVRQYLRRERCPDWQPGRTCPVQLDGWRQTIDERLRGGCRNAAELHRDLSGQGHDISYYAVRRFVRRRLLSLGQPRQADRMQSPTPRPPSAQQLAFGVIRRPEERKTEEHAQLETVRGLSPDLRGALELADEFAAMLRKTLSQPLSVWLAKAAQSECPEMRGFARGLRQDEAAVAAALEEKWSNGPVEGHVNRLKVLKRQMYGRAGFELLRARVMSAA
jgi:transposase